tara:strand:+ start:544 stop:711 length:168 start_codon:yes stop_codon:yes gene_type:complete
VYYLKGPIFIPINGERIMHTTTMTLNYLLVVSKSAKEINDFMNYLIGISQKLLAT